MSAATIDAERAVAQGQNFMPAWKGRDGHRAAAETACDAVADMRAALDARSADEDTRSLRGAHHPAACGDEALAGQRRSCDDAATSDRLWQSGLGLSLAAANTDLAADSLDSGAEDRSEKSLAGHHAPPASRMRDRRKFDRGAVGPMPPSRWAQSAEAVRCVYGNRGMAYFSHGQIRSRRPTISGSSPPPDCSRPPPLWVWMAKNRAGENDAAARRARGRPTAPVYAYLDGKINRVDHCSPPPSRATRRRWPAGSTTARLLCQREKMIDRQEADPEAELMLSQASVVQGARCSSVGGAQRIQA